MYIFVIANNCGTQTLQKTIEKTDAYQFYRIGTI